LDITNWLWIFFAYLVSDLKGPFRPLAHDFTSSLAKQFMRAFLTLPNGFPAIAEIKQLGQFFLIVT
jgi:hypothetical protein